VHTSAPRNRTNLAWLISIQEFDFRKTAFSKNFLPLKDWNHIQKNLEELDRLKNKKIFMVELAEAIEEMKLIMKGKKQARNAEDFINEL
jgi:hypothetical protein